MGRKQSGRRRRIRLPKQDANTLERIRENEVVYQYCLRTLLRTLPEGSSIQTSPRVAVLGRTEIWPCIDGAVKYTFLDSAKNISVEVMEYQHHTMQDFQMETDRSLLRTKDGRQTDQHCSVSLEPKPGISGRSLQMFFAKMSIAIPGRPPIEVESIFDRGAIIGWEAKLTSPDTAALTDFRYELAVHNIVSHLGVAGNQPWKTPANRLALDYSEVLDRATAEEDVQKYLKSNPEIVFPDHISVLPKFKLGDDYVTDFVFLIQGQSGRQYVFVEIECPTKPVFIKSGLSSGFTQAKGQILDWKRWIRKHHSYVRDKLPGLHKPQFLLVMGRSAETRVSDRSERLEEEFSASDISFATFDDLLERFRRVIENAGKPSSGASQ